MPLQVQWAPFVSVNDDAVGWLDEDFFNGWLREALRLANDASVGIPRAGESADEQRERQRAHVHALGYALSQCYAAIDTPPPADPAYVDAELSAFNPSEEEVEGDPPRGGEYARRVAAVAYQPARYIDIRRAWLNENAELQGESLTFPVDQWLASGDVNVRRWVRFETLEPLAQWQYGAVHINCARRSGINCDEWDTDCCVPPLWDFWKFKAVAYALERRGARATMAEARGYCALRNVRLARRAGLSSSAQGAALMGAAELALANAQEAGAATNREVGTILGTVAAVVTVANPLIGGVVGALAAVAALLPAPVAYPLDAWGRRWPAFQRWRITGGAGLNDRPTHAVAPPPGLTARPPRAELLVVLPRSVPNAEVRVDENEWRPAVWRDRVLYGAHLVEGRAPGKGQWGRTVTVRGEPVQLVVDAAWFDPPRSGPLEPLEPAPPPPPPPPPPGPRPKKTTAKDKPAGEELPGSSSSSSGSNSSSSSGGSSSSSSSSSGSSSSSSSWWTPGRVVGAVVGAVAVVGTVAAVANALSDEGAKGIDPPS